MNIDISQLYMNVADSHRIITWAPLEIAFIIMVDNLVVVESIEINQRENTEVLEHEIDYSLFT